MVFFYMYTTLKWLKKLLTLDLRRQDNTLWTVGVSQFEDTFYTSFWRSRSFCLRTDGNVRFKLFFFFFVLSFCFSLRRLSFLPDSWGWLFWFLLSSLPWVFWWTAEPPLTCSRNKSNHFGGEHSGRVVWGLLPYSKESWVWSWTDGLSEWK